MGPSMNTAHRNRLGERLMTFQQDVPERHRGSSRFHVDGRVGFDCGTLRICESASSEGASSGTRAETRRAKVARGAKLAMAGLSRSSFVATSGSLDLVISLEDVALRLLEYENRAYLAGEFEEVKTFAQWRRNIRLAVDALCFGMRR